MSTFDDRADAGFTMIELITMLSLSVLMLLALHSTLFSSIQTREQTEVQERRNDLAYSYMQRMLTIPFGTAADTAATATQLTELFDDDAELGAVTLRHLETAAGTPGHSFTTARDDVTTLWRVSVTSDLDRDGATTGFREGRTDLLMIEVYGENRLLFRTIRAADYANTVKD